MRRTDFLYVPELGWKLWVYLLVIPAIVYVAAQPSTAAFKAAPSVAANVAAASSQEGVGQGAVASAAPLLAIHRGEAITCFTHPDITMCHKWTKERR